MLFRKSIAAVLLAASAMPISAAYARNQPVTGAESQSEKLRAALDARMPQWLAEQNVPSAAVALIADGEIAWTSIHGEQSPGTPADARTLYNVASLTKPIVAETILRLAAQGKLDIDAPLAEQFTDRDLGDERRAAAITLRHALSHRTGFPANWRAEMPEGKLRIDWNPGTKAHYSGENYALSARYAMMATQTRLDHLAKAAVFDSAEIDDIWFLPDETWEGRVAMVRGPDGELVEPENSPQGSAADNVHATIGDYAEFIAGSMRGDGLTPELVEARGTIYDDQVDKACPPELIDQKFCPAHSGYGLGWMIYDSGENRIFLHNGKDWGERTIALFIPARKLGVVVFTSGANGRQVIADTLKLLVPDEKLNVLVQAEADFEKASR